MKKILLSAVFIASLISCVAKDDISANISANISALNAVDLAPKKSITTSITPAGTSVNEIIFSYSDANKIASIKQSNGKINNFTYQGDLLVKEDGKEDGVDITTNYIYDTNAKLTEMMISRSNGKKTQYKYSYNSNGKISNVISKTNHIYEGYDSVNSIMNDVSVDNTTEYQYTYNDNSHVSFKIIESKQRTFVGQAKPFEYSNSETTGSIKLDNKANVILIGGGVLEQSYTFDDKPLIMLNIKGFSVRFINDNFPGFSNFNNQTSAIKTVQPTGLVSLNTTVSLPTITSITEYTYDLHGRVIKEITKEKDKIVSTTQYFY